MCKYIAKKMPYLIAIILPIILFCLISGCIDTKYGYSLKGSGSYNNPYIIASSEDLCYFAELVNNGDSFNGCYIDQVNDIDMTDTSFYPIGCTEKNIFFSGVYDGNGHVIKGLNYVSDNDENVGFFNTLCGTVRNLYLEECGFGGLNVGGIASELNNGQIVNCYVSGYLFGWNTGGIVGINSNGTIENSLSYIILEAKNNEGGISSDKTKYLKCYSNLDDGKTNVISENTIDRLNRYVNKYNDNYTDILSNWTIDEDGFQLLNLN